MARVEAQLKKPKQVRDTYHLLFLFYIKARVSVLASLYGSKVVITKTTRGSPSALRTAWNAFPRIVVIVPSSMG